MMGLYESELNKQIHLRNRQRREWDMLNKNMEIEGEKRKRDISEQEKMLEQERREENRIEIAETEASKTLTQAMVRSSQEDDCQETLLKVVDVLRDQNG